MLESRSRAFRVVLATLRSFFEPFFEHFPETRAWLDFQCAYEIESRSSVALLATLLWPLWVAARFTLTLSELQLWHVQQIARQGRSGAALVATVILLSTTLWVSLGGVVLAAGFSKPVQWASENILPKLQTSAPSAAANTEVRATGAPPAQLDQPSLLLGTKCLIAEPRKAEDGIRRVYPMPRVSGTCDTITLNANLWFLVGFDDDETLYKNTVQLDGDGRFFGRVSIGLESDLGREFRVTLAALTPDLSATWLNDYQPGANYLRSTTLEAATSQGAITLTTERFRLVPVPPEMTASPELVENTRPIEPVEPLKDTFVGMATK